MIVLLWGSAVERAERGGGDARGRRLGREARRCSPRAARQQRPRGVEVPLARIPAGRVLPQARRPRPA